MASPIQALPLTPTQLGITLAQSLTAISDNKNTAAIALWKQNGGPLPTLEYVDSTMVIELENEANALIVSGQTASLDNLNWQGIYSYKLYLPPVPPPKPDMIPTSIVQPTGKDYPGFYQLTPDSPAVPVGEVVQINGLTFTKEIISQNPFAYNGGVTAWKVS